MIKNAYQITFMRFTEAFIPLTPQYIFLVLKKKVNARVKDRVCISAFFLRTFIV